MIKVPVELLNETVSRIIKVEPTLVQNTSILNSAWNGLKLEAASRRTVGARISQARSMASRLSAEANRLSSYVSTCNSSFIEADRRETGSIRNINNTFKSFSQSTNQLNGFFAANASFIKLGGVMGGLISMVGIGGVLLPWIRERIIPNSTGSVEKKWVKPAEKSSTKNDTINKQEEKVHGNENSIQLGEQRLDVSGLSIDQKGLDFIKATESGDVPQLANMVAEGNIDIPTPNLDAYKCEANVWTIGYGHTGAEAYPGNRITENQAEELLRQDLRQAENDVKRLISEYGGNQPLTQNEYNSLVSFVFNLGYTNIASYEDPGVFRVIREGNFDQVPEQMSRWTAVQGSPSEGIANRRMAEGELWSTQDS